MTPGQNPFGRMELLTDLYELTMAACYHHGGFEGSAAFSLFVRKNPPNRGFLVFAGLEDVLSYLEGFSFSPEDLEYLESTGLFRRDFLNTLKEMKFEGDVFALPEGTVFFPNEPVLEVRAPMIQAQIIETFLLNAINLQATIATKAARCYIAGRGRGLTDFSLRRTQGIDAGLKVARASYIGGFDGTSNVLAGKLYGLPIFGTMAHSFVMVHKSEIDAFHHFAEVFPDATVLLIDTYDDIEGAGHAVEVAKRLKERGRELLGVRLDSGDIAELSKKVREILDDAGFSGVKIFASGNLDEYSLEELAKKGAAIDGYGVGTQMGTSADAPFLDVVYKITEYEGRRLLKLSSGKVTLVGEKQVYRTFDTHGKMARDTICLRDEPEPEGEPLLIKVMEGGERVHPPEGLAAMQQRCLKNLAALPDECKKIVDPGEYPVGLGPGLQNAQEEEEKRVKKEAR